VTRTRHFAPPASTTKFGNVQRRTVIFVHYADRNGTFYDSRAKYGISELLVHTCTCVLASIRYSSSSYDFQLRYTGVNNRI